MGRGCNKWGCQADALGSLHSVAPAFSTLVLPYSYGVDLALSTPPLGMQSDATVSKQPGLRLSNELLSSIFEFLVIARPVVTECRPYDEGVLWTAITGQRRTLHSLCMACRLFDSIAKPYLYQVVVLWEEAGLPLFLRTLLENGQYCGLVQSFSCQLNLTTDGVPPAVFGHFQRAFSARALFALPGLPSIIAGLQTFQKQQCSDFEIKKLPQLLFLAILNLIGEIDTLLLQFPLLHYPLEWDQDPSYQVLVNYATSELGVPSLKKTAASTLCPKLKILHLQGDPKARRNRGTEWTTHAGGAKVVGTDVGLHWRFYSAFPGVHTIVATCENGLWMIPPRTEDTEESEDEDDPDPCQLDHVRRLYLHDSFHHPLDLSTVLETYPCLEILHMTPRILDSEQEGMSDLPLEDALVQYGQSLRELRVGFFFCWGRWFETIGNEGKLGRLSELSNLKRLHVQLGLLCNKSEPYFLSENPLATLLPSTIELLTLEDWDWESAQYVREDRWRTEIMKPGEWCSRQAQRREWIRDGLRVLADSVRQLPYLRRLQYGIRIRESWESDGDDSIENNFGDLKERFANMGVDFTTYVDENEWL